MNTSDDKVPPTDEQEIEQVAKLLKNKSQSFQSIPFSVLINILIFIFTAIGTYLLMVNHMDSKLEESIDIKVGKYQNELEKLIKKADIINDSIVEKAKASKRMVALISDFGSASYYTANFKGRIISNQIYANILDITHEIRSFDIIEGAWILANTTKHLPEETIIWGIINPGAPIRNSALFVVTKNPRQYFIGGSRELFDNVVANQGLEAAYRPCFRDEDDKFGTKTFSEIITILLSGGDIKDLIAEKLISKDIVKYDLQLKTTENPVQRDHSVCGYICSIDRWGNILTNIPPDKKFFEHNTKYGVEINSIKMTDVLYCSSYSEGRDRTGIIIEQDGWIQVAVHLKKANEYFNLFKTGSPIKLYKMN